MVIEVKEKFARLDNSKTQKWEKKTLADIYGKLKRGLDGLEYQKTVRNGDWD